MTWKPTPALWERLLTDLADLLTAGIDLDIALRMIARRAGPVPSLANALREAVLAGRRVTDGLEKLGCPALTLCIVRTGEATGELELAMAKAGTRLTEKRRRLERVRALLLYPAVLSLMCLAVTYLLAAVVLPDFDRLFRAFHLPEGVLTIFLFWISGAVAKAGPSVVAGVSLFGAGLYIRRKNTGAWLEACLLRSRAVRPFWQLIRSRAAFEGLSALLGGGVDLLGAVRLLAVQDQPALRRGWDEVARILEGGGTLSDALRKWDFIHPAVSDIVLLAEQTGDLPRGAERASQYLDRACGRLAERAAQVAEPAATAVLGLVVGGATLFFMVPMLDLVKQLS